MPQHVSTYLDCYLIFMSTYPYIRLGYLPGVPRVCVSMCLINDPVSLYRKSTFLPQSAKKGSHCLFSKGDPGEWRGHRPAKSRFRRWR